MFAAKQTNGMTLGYYGYLKRSAQLDDSVIKCY